MTPRNSQTEICHDCGKELQREIRPLEISYKGETLIVDQPGLYCSGCGEGLLDGKDLATTRIARAGLKARVEGLLSPDEVRRIRTKLRLSQRKAGEILGGGSRAFHKYESGLVTVSQAMSNLLRLLDQDPKLLLRLKIEAA